MIRPIVHFVGFRGQEYAAAVRVWGHPDYIHMLHDKRMYRDFHPIDTVVFGKRGTDEISEYNASDLLE